MKRKKWTEAEEETLLTSYSDLISSSCDLISQMLTREKKFQPIADRINNLHHLHDSAAFPFLWTWKDISIKIQNMRHQYLNTKLKLPPHSSATNNSDWDHALHLWPNFLRYKTVFGDIESFSSAASENASAASEDDKVAILERPASENASAASEDDKVANLERETRRRRERWRRREEEEMEWREKMVGMQMEHEKRVLQMHEETCQAQTQMIGVVVRLVCQFFGTGAGGGGGGGGGDGGINGLHNLQQQQQEEEESAGGSLVGDDVKNGVNSGEDYL